MKNIGIEKTGLDIAAQAKLYLGTPFHHQGRSKHGLDCIGLLVRVLDDLNIDLQGKPASTFDTQNYGRQPSAPFLTTPLNQLFEKVLQPQIGDVLLFAIEKAPRHVAIVTDVTGDVMSFIHAYEPYGEVRIDDDLGARWRKRLCDIYRLPSLSVLSVEQ